MAENGQTLEGMAQQANAELNPDVVLGRRIFESTNEGNESGSASDEGAKINVLMNGENAERPASSGEPIADRGAESFLDSGNKGFFAKMSEDGRSLMTKMYDGLYKIPGVNRIVGKLEIAYNQAWMDRHQEKAVSLRTKMDNIEMKRGILSQTKQEIESSIAELRRLGVPRAESLQLKLGKLELEDAELLRKKNEVQSRFEKQDNKVKLYANERDEIAGRLIGRYDEKLNPMEKELENLHALRDQADFVASAMESKHGERTREISGLESRKDKIAELLKRGGSKEREIRKTLEPLIAQINEGREKMRIEKANLARRQKEINRKIAKLDAKANPYRDKREEFVRVKENRPLDISIEARKKSREFLGQESVSSHSREESDDILSEGSGDSENSVEDNQPVESVESAQEDDSRLTLGDYISGYNAYLQEKGSSDAKKSLVDPKDLIRSSIFLSKDSQMDFERFKDVLKKYLKFKKIPMNNFEENISGVKDKLESEK